MRDDFDIIERIEREAGSLPAPRFTITDVRRTGKRRRLRGRLLGGLATAAVVSVAISAINLLPGGDPPITSGGADVTRPDEGAEPLVDLTAVGSEIRLLAFDPPVEDLERIASDLTIAPGTPILAVGQVEGTAARVYRAFGRLEPGVNPAGDLWDHDGDAWCEWVFGLQDVIGPSCSRGIHGLPIAGTGAGEAGVFVWVLPGEVAFAVVESDDGLAWQRPRGGVVAVPSEAARAGAAFFDRYGVPLDLDPEFWRDPMPAGVEPYFDAALPTPELEDVANLRDGDILYRAPVGDRLVLMRVRSPRGPDGSLQVEAPLLFGTACGVVQSVPLPRRWRGACLERITDGELVHGPFFFGTDLPFGGWSDDGWGAGVAWSTTPLCTVPEGADPIELHRLHAEGVLVDTAGPKGDPEYQEWIREENAAAAFGRLFHLAEDLELSWATDHLRQLVVVTVDPDTPLRPVVAAIAETVGADLRVEVHPRCVRIAQTLEVTAALIARDWHPEAADAVYGWGVDLTGRVVVILDTGSAALEDTLVDRFGYVVRVSIEDLAP